MNEAVLDSSAVLALLFEEPGASRVAVTLPGALISAVNLAEVMSKLRERGMPADLARSSVEETGVQIVDFDADQAWLAGDLRPMTRPARLSLGDRACLALGCLRKLTALTTDRAWAQLEGFDVTVIR
jgi:PIN domain nuclease of toxin-antitoxin system